MRNGHWKAKELEMALAKRMKVEHAQLVSSGTAALTVALASAGINAGDEVILPTFTFVASFEAVLSVGAVPVLVDVDDTLTLDPTAVEKAITKKTKVIMPVHMCGSMADLGALKALCHKYKLILLEDACQAIGGSYEGKPLGSLDAFRLIMSKPSPVGREAQFLPTTRIIIEMRITIRIMDMII
jgi:8-amino-3,8-dideoxy-alpha-D-manno-octulosonate transaminase